MSYAAFHAFFPAYGVANSTSIISATPSPKSNISPNPNTTTTTTTPTSTLTNPILPIFYPHTFTQPVHPTDFSPQFRVKCRITAKKLTSFLVTPTTHTLMLPAFQLASHFIEASMPFMVKLLLGDVQRIRPGKRGRFGNLFVLDPTLTSHELGEKVQEKIADIASTLRYSASLSLSETKGHAMAIRSSRVLPHGSPLEARMRK